MTGGINNVNGDAVFKTELLSGWTTVVDSRVLREDRNALFAFKITRVHDALARLLDGVTVRKSAGLPEHRVDQGCLTVVNVRHDCDITQVRAGWHR